MSRDPALLEPILICQQDFSSNEEQSCFPGSFRDPSREIKKARFAQRIPRIPECVNIISVSGNNGGECGAGSDQ